MEVSEMDAVLNGSHLRERCFQKVTEEAIEKNQAPGIKREMKETPVGSVEEGETLKINGFPFQSFHLARHFSEEEFERKAK